MHLKKLHFISGLKMSGAVEKLLFTSLWNRYQEQIPGIKLIQIGAISILLIMPALTHVSLLERYLVLETAMPRGDIRKRPSAHP
jgi:hypothetical protein